MPGKNGRHIELDGYTGEVAEKRRQIAEALNNLDYTKLDIKRDDIKKDLQFEINMEAIDKVINLCRHTVTSMIGTTQQFNEILPLVLMDNLSDEELKKRCPSDYRDYIDILRMAIEIDANNLPKLYDITESLLQGLEASPLSEEEKRELENENNQYAKTSKEYLASYDDNRNKANQIIRKTSMLHKYRPHSFGDRWSHVLKMKPGITEEEIKLIDELSYGPKKNTEALAKMYVDELLSMPTELLDKYTLDDMSQSSEMCHKLEYYGMLAMDSDMMLKSQEKNLYKYYYRDQLDCYEQIRQNVLSLHTNIRNECEVYSHPASRYVDITKMSNDDAINFYDKCMGKTDLTLNSVQKFALNLFRYKEYQENNKIELEKKPAREAFDKFSKLLDRKTGNEKKVDFEEKFATNVAGLLPSEQNHSSIVDGYKGINKKEGNRFAGLELSKEGYLFAEYMDTIRKIKGDDSVPGRLTKERIEELIKLNGRVVESIKKYDIQENHEKAALLSELQWTLKMDRDILVKAKSHAEKTKESMFFDEQVIEAKTEILQEKKLKSVKIEEAKNTYKNKHKDRIEEYYKDLGNKMLSEMKEIRDGIGEKLRLLDSHLAENGFEEKDVNKIYKLRKSMQKIASKHGESVEDLRIRLGALKEAAKDCKKNSDKKISDISKSASEFADKGQKIIKENYDIMRGVYESEKTLKENEQLQSPNTFSKVPMENVEKKELRIMRGWNKNKGREIKHVDRYKKLIPKYKESLLESISKTGKANKAVKDDCYHNLAIVVALENAKKNADNHIETTIMFNQADPENAELKNFGPEYLNSGNDYSTLYSVKQQALTIEKSDAMELMRSAWNYQTENIDKMKACYEACVAHQSDINKMRTMTVEELEASYARMKNGKGPWIHKSGVKAFDAEIMATKAEIIEHRIAVKLEERSGRIEKSIFELDIHDAGKEPVNSHEQILDTLKKCISKPITPEMIGNLFFSEGIYKICDKHGYPVERADIDGHVKSYVDVLGEDSQLISHFINNREDLINLAPFVADGSISELFKFKISNEDLVLEKQPTIDEIKIWAAKKRENSVKNADEVIKNWGSRKAKLSEDKDTQEILKKGMNSMKYYRASIANREIIPTRANASNMAEIFKNIIKANVMTNHLKSGLTNEKNKSVLNSLERTKTAQNIFTDEFVLGNIDKVFSKENLDKLSKKMYEEARAISKVKQGPAKH